MVIINNNKHVTAQGVVKSNPSKKQLVFQSDRFNEANSVYNGIISFYKKLGIKKRPVFKRRGITFQVWN
jgi:hypothetical protein